MPTLEVKTELENKTEVFSAYLILQAACPPTLPSLFKPEEKDERADGRQHAWHDKDFHIVHDLSITGTGCKVISNPTREERPKVHSCAKRHKGNECLR